jgi:hypothetical protein
MKKFRIGLYTAGFTLACSVVNAMPADCARAAAAAINGWQWLYYGARCVIALAGADPYNM